MNEQWGVVFRLPIVAIYEGESFFILHSRVGSFQRLLIRQTTNVMKKVLFILPVLALLYMASCKKDDVDPVNGNPLNTVTYSTAQDYLNAKNVPLQSFTVNASSGGSFTGAKGTEVIIAPNTFIHYDGSPVAGSVQVQLKEVFSARDMIFSGVYPVSYGSILKSGGEFFLQASQDGIPVDVQAGQLVEVNMPAQDVDPNMMLFFGAGDADPDSLNWDPIENNEGDSLGVNNFTFNVGDGAYELTLDSLGWANIDAFDFSVTYFPMEFELTGVAGLNGSNTSAWAVFDGGNSVWPTGVPTWGSIEDNVIYETHLGAIPLTFVVVSVVDNQLYYGHMSLTPSEGTDYTINLEVTTEAALDAFLGDL